MASVLAWGASGQQTAPQEPPEEDESVAGKHTYSFNPLQAEKEIKVGDFYSKKGSHKAATLRYREATRWNPGSAEAWLKLGESLEKQRDRKGANEAFAKYLELEPQGKSARQVRQKLAGKP
jgi:tetratricopeptide (TPR) repeat protein